MDPIYAGDIGTIITVDCGVDVSSAASLALVVLTPLGVTLTWPAALVDGSTSEIQYTTQSGDLAEPGTYRVQAQITMGSWSGRGATAKLTVRQKFS